MLKLDPTSSFCRLEYQMLRISTTECIAFVLKQKFYVLRQKIPKNQISNRIYVDSILQLGHLTWHPISKYVVFLE